MIYVEQKNVSKTAGQSSKTQLPIPGLHPYLRIVWFTVLMFYTLYCPEGCSIKDA